ncbi:MAG: nucleoside-diphosphate kinase [Anaerolineae bacterium]|nr:nucleoside-diphosphate kinase [Anaerolineae bacterium]
MTQNELEQTLVLIKPDALKNSLTGYVLSQLAEFHTHLHFAAAKIVCVSQMLAEEHYAEHKDKLFFPALITYIMGYSHYPEDAWKRRVVAFVYQGPDAIKLIRAIAGPTNPHVAREEQPGCIRALGTVVPIKDDAGNVISERLDNLIHASANESDAEREIKLWFKPNDIPPMMHIYPTDVSEQPYYFKDNQLLMTHEPDSVCLIAPGDVVWQSDLEALRVISQGQASPCTLKAVAAKYLINDKRECCY